MNAWAKDMMLWSEHVDACRAMTSAWWLGAALVAQACWQPVTSLAAGVRGGTARGGVRMPSVSDAWLREHEVEAVKHDG